MTKENESPENAVIKFLKLADELIDENPYLYVEIARTRQTDWMCWLRKKPEGDLIANSQGATANGACENALFDLAIILDKEKSKPSAWRRRAGSEWVYRESEPPANDGFEWQALGKFVDDKKPYRTA